VLHALKARGRDDREAGFTLIEILVAMVLMAIVMSSLAVFFIGAQKSSSSLRMRQDASVLADEAMDKVHSVAVDELTLNRDKSSSDAQWATAVANTTVVGVDVSGMNELYDTTSVPLPPNGTGTNALVTPLPTVPQQQVVNKTPFFISYFMGTCWVPLGGGNCVKTQASSTDVVLDRVITAVNWVQPGSSCYLNRCAYVIASLISTTDDPTFNVNQVVVDTTPPSIPTLAPCAATSDQSIQLGSWANSTDASGVARYDIYEGLAADTSSMVKDGSQTTNAAYTDTGLVPNTTYYYVVYAFDTVGNQSGPQVPVGTVTNPQAPFMVSCTTLPDTTAPTAPAGITATSTSSTVTLNWTTAGTDDYKVAGYQIFRNGGTTPVGTASASALTFTDTGLTPWTTYTYQIKTVDMYGNLSPATPATPLSKQTTDTVAPVKTVTNPLSPATLVSPTQINLDWADYSDDVAVTSYQVYRGTSAGSLTFLATTTTSSYANTSLPTNTTYYYAVYALDAAGNKSVVSNTVSASTPDSQPPTAPTTVTSTAKTATSVTLSWSGATDNVLVTGYSIYRGGVLVGTSATTSFVDSGLTSVATYVYTVKANDAAGNVSPFSGSYTVTTLDGIPPNSPTLSNTSLTQTQVGLSWTQPSDNVGVTGYSVFEDGGTTAITTTTGATATTFTDTGEAPGTTHTYTVKARDAAGNFSVASNVLTVTLNVDPAAPTKVTAHGTSTSNNSVNISWAASTSTPTAINGYKVYFNGTLVSSVGAGVLAVAVSPLTSGSTYLVTVYATNTAGKTSPVSTTLTCVVASTGSVSCS
jgi:prepilin-type N-terminal cleavage/methylation domain-containing protein